MILSKLRWAAVFALVATATHAADTDSAKNAPAAPPVAAAPSAPAPKPLNVSPLKFTYTGYVQGRYVIPFDDSGKSRSEAQLRRAILWLRAGVTDNIGVVFDISGASGFVGQGAAGTPNNTVTGTKFIEVYGEYLKAPYSGRIGLSRIPFGYEVQAGTHTLITLERSKVVDTLLPVGRYAYDRGVFGYYLPTKGATFAVAVVNGEDLDVASDSNHGKNIVSRLGVRGPKSNIGVSYYDGTLAERNASGAYTGSGAIQDVNRFGFDALVTAGSLTFIGEYLRGETGAVKSDGWYLTAGYQKPGSPHQTYIRYDEFDPNTSAGNDQFKRWTVGHSIYFSKLTKWTLEYESLDDKASPSLDGRLTTQIQVVF